jgi:hypothetical protein
MTSGKKPRGPRSQCPKQHKARRRIAEEDSCLCRSSEKRNLSELVIPRSNVSSTRLNLSSRVRMCHPQSESVSPSEDLAFGPGQVVVPCALRNAGPATWRRARVHSRRKDEKIIQASQNEKRVRISTARFSFADPSSATMANQFWRTWDFAVHPKSQPRPQLSETIGTYICDTYIFVHGMFHVEHFSSSEEEPTRGPFWRRRR